MALDRYTIQIGRDIIQSVKNGHHYTPVLQADLFHKDFREILGVDESYTHKDGQGKIIYSLVNVKPGFHITNQLDTQVKFTLRIPIRIGESTLFTAEFPLSLTGTYQYKY